MFQNFKFWNIHKIEFFFKSDKNNLSKQTLI